MSSPFLLSAYLFLLFHLVQLEGRFIFRPFFYYYYYYEIDASVVINNAFRRPFSLVPFPFFSVEYVSHFFLSQLMASFVRRRPWLDEPFD